MDAKVSIIGYLCMDVKVSILGYLCMDAKVSIIGYLCMHAKVSIILLHDCMFSDEKYTVVYCFCSVTFVAIEYRRCINW